MKPVDATLATVMIENMIMSSIAAALSGKIKDPDYEAKMQDLKARIAEIFETL